MENKKKHYPPPFITLSLSTTPARWERLATLIGILLSALALFCSINCSGTSPTEVILNDFEADADLDRLHWSCHTLFSISDDHATHGSKSLKIDLFPSDYPGMSFIPSVKDWREYRMLSFDAYNPSEKPMQLTVRIDDKKDFPEYNHRYNKSFILNEGSNHIVIPVDSIVASESGRHLDLAHICRIFAFSAGPHAKTTLYIDTIKITK